MKQLAIVFPALLLASSLLAPMPARAIEVAFERDASVPLVYLNVAVKSGSVVDPENQSGISNFMGEMLLRGTKSRTKEQIDLELDQMGAKLEVEVRAEALILRGAVLTSQLDRFLRLVSDIITQPSFPDQEIRKLKGEVESGILEELGRDATLANRRFTKFLFQGHPYGKPVLGTVKDIDKLTRAQIIAHYNKMFRDQQLLVVGTGEASVDKIQAWAQAIAQSRPGDNQLPKIPAPQDSTKIRLQLVDKPDRTQTQIYGGQIGLRMTDERFFPLYLANHSFGGGSFSARLMVEIRVKRGWSYGANSYFRHGTQPRSWQLYTFPAAKDTAPALGLTLQLVRDLQAKGITQEEFDFAKHSLVNSAGFMYNTPKKRVENKLLERTLDLPDGFMKTYGPNIDRLTLGQVNAAVKAYIKPDHMAFTVLGTAQDLKEPLAKAVGIDPKDVQVTPYTQE